MDTLSITALLALGFGLGLKHATEADHLAAVSTIVSERKNIWSSAVVGGLWGVGHTISLFIAGIAVILFHLEISERTSQLLEFCVALMLIVLGLNALRKLVMGGKLHLHPHSHGNFVHPHPHIHEKGTAHNIEQGASPEHEHKIGARPLVVGMIHGLAGSGALMLLVLATIPTPAVGISYILIFGAGSIGGMMLMSMLIGLPFHFTAKRFIKLDRIMRGAAGLFSLGFGLFMVYDIGFVGGLFGV